MKRTDQGLTLLELIMATILLCIVFFTATTIMINFKNFFIRSTQSAPSLIDAATAFEQIVNTVSAGNSVAISNNNSTIQIRVDAPNTPGAFGDDVLYTYSLDSTDPNNKKVLCKVGNGANSILADKITSLSFNWLAAQTAAEDNVVKITLTTNVTGTADTMATTVTARSRSAFD